MKGWIFNASPLILLGKIQQLHLIGILSPDFRIPRTVVAEIGDGPVDDRTIKWLTQASIADHIIDTPSTPPFLAQWDLGAGETSSQLGIDRERNGSDPRRPCSTQIRPDFWTALDWDAWIADSRQKRRLG